MDQQINAAGNLKCFFKSENQTLISLALIVKYAINRSKTYLNYLYRQHDLGCPAAIQPGEELLGLKNDRFFTMMHCSCDER